MGELVLIYTTHDGAAGWVLRGRLESEDIPVFTKGEAEGPYRLGPAYLYVPEEFEVQARLIIDQALAGGLEIPEDENELDEEILDRDLEL